VLYVPFVELEGFANPVPEGDAGLAPPASLPSAPPSVAVAPVDPDPDLELDDPAEPPRDPDDDEPLLPPLPPPRRSRVEEIEFDEVSCGRAVSVVARREIENK
jgi:hypothetical protein